MFWPQQSQRGAAILQLFVYHVFQVVHNLVATRSDLRILGGTDREFQHPGASTARKGAVWYCVVVLLVCKGDLFGTGWVKNDSKGASHLLPALLDEPLEIWGTVWIHCRPLVFGGYSKHHLVSQIVCVPRHLQATWRQSSRPPNHHAALQGRVSTRPYDWVAIGHTLQPYCARSCHAPLSPSYSSSSPLFFAPCRALCAP